MNNNNININNNNNNNNNNAQNSVGFWGTNGSFNLWQTTKPCESQQKKKKRTCRIVNFAVSADHRVKLKESENRDKYLPEKWKVLRKIKVTLIPIVIGVLVTVIEGLIPGGLRNKRASRDHQITALLRSATILRIVLETWGDLLSLRLLWKSIS